MKALAKYFLIALLLSAYSVGTIGVAMYSCHCRHSRQIVLLGHDKCTCNHSTEKHCCNHEHNQTAEKHCCNHEHNQTTKKHCCNITYQVLQLDQEASKHTLDFNSYSIAKVLFLPVTLMNISVPRLVAFHSHDPPPLIHSLSPDIYCLAQLRL